MSPLLKVRIFPANYLKTLMLVLKFVGQLIISRCFKKTPLRDLKSTKKSLNQSLTGHQIAEVTLQDVDRFGIEGIRSIISLYGPKGIRGKRLH